MSPSTTLSTVGQPTSPVRSTRWTLSCTAVNRSTSCGRSAGSVVVSIRGRPCRACQQRVKASRSTTSHRADRAASSKELPQARPVEIGWVIGVSPRPRWKWYGTKVNAAGTIVAAPVTSDRPATQATVVSAVNGRQGNPGWAYWASS